MLLVAQNPLAHARGSESRLLVCCLPSHDLLSRDLPSRDLPSRALPSRDRKGAGSVKEPV
jgi:hypothetical protein